MRPRLKGAFALLIFLGVPLATFAAFDDVSLSNVTISLTVGGSALSVTASSATIESITVSGGSFDVALQATSTITITSSDKREFTLTPSPLPTTATQTFTCGSDSSTLKLSATGAITVTVTPHASGTCSAAAAAAGGGGGGGLAGAIAKNLPPFPPPPAVLMPPPPSPQAVSFLKDLAFGDENEDVRALQALLATDPSIYPQGTVTGYYGPLTLAAVKRFQAKYGLPQVGRVGPLTRAKLAEVFGGGAAVPTPPSAPLLISRSLQVGSAGDEVRALQAFLARDGEVYPEGLVTGNFGPATERAVKRFQAKYGIEAIGVVGPLTRAKINELAGTLAPTLPAPTPLPASTEEQAKIEALQIQLRVLQEQLKALQNQ